MIKNNYYDVLDDDEESDDEDDHFYQRNATDIAYTGAGVRGGFEHTSEINMLKYREAMASEDRKQGSNK